MENKSYWLESTKEAYPALTDNISTDICIIGGGLFGLTTAYMLSKRGFRVAILEKDTICSKASGNTTAKVTSQHGLFYKYLIDSNGIDYAKKYFDANENAIKRIEDIIKTENINCDWEQQDNYIYTNEQAEVEKIKQEVEALHKIGAHAEFVTEMPLKLPILGALKNINQAQFHPVKYALGLTNIITLNNGHIYENTKVIDIQKQENSYKVITNTHDVTAKYVVIATNYPIINFPGFYFMKMYQSMSYVVAATTDEDLPEGMYINTTDPALSFRTVPYNNKRLLLAIGADHKTGKMPPNDLDPYIYLENKLKELYPAAQIQYRWSTEDTISLDKIPYIGMFSELMPQVYVGTGFKKWGMTLTNIAANIITDCITEKQSGEKEIFTSTRLRPIKNYQEIINMTKQVAKSLVVEKLTIPEETIKSIQIGEGKIIEIDGKKVGVYKDKQENLHKIKPVCTHLGCELTFNNIDKTWDCPCHGSRFNYDGKSIYAPSVSNLKKM